MNETAEQRRRAFSVWLRTGQLLDTGRELKFNPWHDTRNGRFTFSGAGRFYGRGSAAASGTRGRQTAKIIFKPDPVKPRLNTPEEVNAWAAALLREHANERGFPEAIEAQRQRYLNELAANAPTPRPSPPTPGSALGKVADFATGLGEGVVDVGKGVAKGFYALATTNPATGAKNIEFGIARAIDGAITAEDTPAHVQLKRAAHAAANASAHDLGHAAGTATGNVALAVAPGALVAKTSAAGRAGKLAKAAAVAVEAEEAPLPIVWVDETLGLKGPAREFNDSAMKARSNVLTRRAQVPAISRTMPDGTKRLVKFDGLDGTYLIERKWAVVTSPAGKAQALRQSQALSEHSLTAIWEVPNPSELKIAMRMLDRLRINNIKVRIVDP